MLLLSKPLRSNTKKLDSYQKMLSNLAMQDYCAKAWGRQEKFSRLLWRSKVYRVMSVAHLGSDTW